MASRLAFTPASYTVDPSFLLKAADLKLNKGLDESPTPITAYYSANTYSEVPSFIHLDASSIESSESEASSSGRGFPIRGTMISLNTLDRFKTVERQELLQAEADALFSSMEQGDACPWHSFLLLIYCDLKTYKFYHWLCVPILQPATPLELAPGSAPQPLPAFLASTAAAAPELITENFLRAAESAAGRGDAGLFPALPAWFLCDSPSPVPAAAALASPEAVPTCSALASRPVLCFSDPSNSPDNPGWPLRNLLLHAARHPSLTGRELTVICVRESRGRADPARCVALTVTLGAAEEDWKPLGWLANDAGRMGPRLADLGPTFSPQALADQAAELNLRLMRWREAPELNLEAIGRQKCLIIGSGTLGCAVSRNLVAWGVRHVTFLDSGKVSYSNPVRQTLFTFADCQNGGKPKAQCAADRLREVLPSVKTEGIQLTIPMPGHLPPDSPVIAKSYQESASQLDSLVQSHDVVFLLTDTRESRWLPTLLGALHNKLVITSALGFDSFLVMRHGEREQSSSSSSSSSSPSPRLGCYYCNDVVAPRDSTRDRSMDQQCTVTRPGLSPIASSLAVEVMVSLVHQRSGSGADASSRFGGAVPHMLRGSLGGWNLTAMEGRAYGQCTACSETVCAAYREGGWEFLKKALEDPASLEELTGLKALHDQILATELELEEAESEEDEAGEGGTKEGGGDDSDEWEEL